MEEKKKFSATFACVCEARIWKQPHVLARSGCQTHLVSLQPQHPCATTEAQPCRQPDAPRARSTPSGCPGSKYCA
eukprot:7381993-Prymnesium_polylepis.4